MSPRHLEHTCCPHSRWGATPKTAITGEPKPQGFVLSPSLRCAIVSRFLHAQKLDASFLKNICSDDQNDEIRRENLRQQVNRELALDITTDQWKQTLLEFRNAFLSRHIDSHDIYNLTTFDYWRVFMGHKRLGAAWWDKPKFRDGDSVLVRCLKMIWTVCWVFCVHFVLSMVIGLVLVMAFLLFGIPFACYDYCKNGTKRKNADDQVRELYKREGIEVAG
jgi:hypothetical protein